MTFDPLARRARPAVVGHRGSPRREVENTIASFDAAIEDGAEIVEMDVHRTSDGVLIVYHDTFIDDGELRRVEIASSTAAEIDDILRRKPAGFLHGRRTGGEAPPRFVDVVRHLSSRVGLDVEIKSPGYEAEVIAVLEREMPATDWVISSFRADVVRECKRLAPSARVGLIVGAPTGGRGLGLRPLHDAEQCGADFVVVHSLLAVRQLLERAASRSIDVFVYTVNSRRRLAKLVNDSRVSGVITDVPALGRSLRGDAQGIA